MIPVTVHGFREFAMLRPTRFLFFLLCASPTLLAAAEPASPRLTVVPEIVTLTGANQRQQLLVFAEHGPAGIEDLTAKSLWTTANPNVAQVTANGIIIAQGDGETEVRANLAGQTLCVRVKVRETAAALPTQFRTDVIAALSRAGCNQGACHGSPQGKNGFKLSLRGENPDDDFLAITRELNGRRINLVEPATSLILQKATGRVPHQGGKLLSETDRAYQAILQWIHEGARLEPSPGPLRLEVLPGDRRLHSHAPEQRIVVLAYGMDGSARDVTDFAVITSSDPSVATVTPSGLVRFDRSGEVSLLVRYLQAMASIRMTYVRHDPSYRFRGPSPANAIDELVFAKHRELQLSPAPVASDEVFLRRVYFDLIGVPPTAEEARAFLDAAEPDKRERLVDALLKREEFAYFWAMKWADVLRGSPTTISLRGVHSFHRYLVRTIAADKPMSEFARELLTGLGNTLHKPAANFYRVARTPEEAAEAMAQLFLGVRMQCAKCHNHPFEAITQTDYYGLAAFFARVQFKGGQFGLDDEIVFLARNRELLHPLRRQPQAPVAFGEPAGILAPEDDRRVALADWLTRPDNKFFAPAIANRVWFHLLGRGIVDPVDDFRDTNPPSNPALLTFLAEQFVKGGYRLKPLIRMIATSRTYQLASFGSPPASAHAAKPERYFTQAAVRVLGAEQILDAVSSATGIPESFPGYPPGTRALEIADATIPHPFLQAFSKPVRDQICECSREEDPSLPQVLHMLNNSQLLEKIRHPDALIARWSKAGKSPEWVIEQIYLATLSRRPTEQERAIITRHFRELGDPLQAYQDLQHALLNTNEFLLRH
jgi:hypothetical protein